MLSFCVFWLLQWCCLAVKSVVSFFFCVGVVMSSCDRCSNARVSLWGRSGEMGRLRSCSPQRDFAALLASFVHDFPQITLLIVILILVTLTVNVTFPLRRHCRELGWSAVQQRNFLWRQRKWAGILALMPQAAARDCSVFRRCFGDLYIAAIVKILLAYLLCMRPWRPQAE